MKHFFFKVVVLCATINIFSYDKNTFKNLHSRYVRTFSKNSDQNIESKVLKALLKISKISSKDSFQSVLESEDIRVLFSQELEDEIHSDENKDIICQSVIGVRYLILLNLYEKILQEYIFSTESFLNSLFSSQNYWNYENFYMKQTFWNKNICYNFYSNQYQSVVDQKIVFLKNLEEQIAHILGVCLYSMTQIEKISIEDQVETVLINLAELFYKTYNTPTFKDSNQGHSLRLFQDLIWINDSLEGHLRTSKKLLAENSKPSFLSEHIVGVSSSAIALIAAAIFYKKNEEIITIKYEDSKKMSSYFYNDIFMNSIYQINDILRNNVSRQQIQEILDGLEKTKIPKREHSEYKDLGIKGSLLGYDLAGVSANDNVHKLLNDKDKLLIDGIDSYNNFIDLAIRVLKSYEASIGYTKLALYSSMVVPVIFAGYLTSSWINKNYNYYLNHQGWHTPMRYIVRSIDQLLNRINDGNNKIDFAESGRIYMLVQHLKEYTSCLQGEELFLMNNDIEELLSFNLNYSQKQSVVRRMYKTYEFLK